MIEKLLPRILNSSSDNRFKKKNEMNDAYNIVVTEDFNDFNANSDTGNQGVIKPVKGNLASPASPVDMLFPNTAERRVLGSVSDGKTGVVFFFVYSSYSVNEQGVYAYDTTNYFGSGTNVYIEIYTDQEFNFQQDSVVQGDIVHVVGESGEFRPILYFTDNVNEPKKLDVSRAVANLAPPDDLTTTDVDRKDFITACPKAPIHPITFEFQREDTARKTSDFRRIPGFQFAFQCVYYSGEESAISTYSDIAVPPEYLRQSVYTSQIEISEVCVLTVPYIVNGNNNFTSEIESIKILVRQGNAGGFFVVDEIPFLNNGQLIQYNFYNDRILTGVTTEEQQKQFDTLPRVAEALSVVENRLFYGNYIEGYDEPNVVADVRATYIQRPADFLNVDINIEPIMVPMSEDVANHTELTADGLKQRRAGYLIDTSEVSDILPPNTTITANITIDPGGAIELYNARKSYHSSIQTGSYINSTENSFHPADYPGSEFSDASTDHVRFDNGILRLYGQNNGVGTDNLKWRSTEVRIGEAQGTVDGLNLTESTTDATLGLSPGSALKFKGEEISFNCEIFISNGSSNGKELVNQAICAAFTEDAEMPDGAEIISGSLIDNPFYTYDLGFLDPTDPGTGYPENPTAEDTSNQSLIDLTNLDLGSSNESLASQPSVAMIPQRGDDFEKLILISPVCDTSQSDLGDDPGTVMTPAAPIGYIIVNKATLQFRLRHQRHLLNNEGARGVMTLEIDSVSGLDIRTCVPIIGSLSFAEDTMKIRGWRVYSGAYLEGHLITDTEQILQDISNVFANITNDLNNSELRHFEQTKKVIGYLRSNDAATVAEVDFYRTPRIIRAEHAAVTPIAVINAGYQDQTIDTFGYSLSDGEGGLRAAQSTFEIDINSEDADLGITAYLYGQPTSGYTTPVGCYGAEQILGGWSAFTGNFEPVNQFHYVRTEAFFTQIWRWSTPLTRCEFGRIYPAVSGSNLSEYFLRIEETDTEQKLELEVRYNAFIQQNELTGDFRSFKTHANHDFGLVYYDERGRAGNVNLLPSVYVQGYNTIERGSRKGRVQIEIDLLSAPPEWAHYYQIVYAGNSSVSNFIQYSVGGAYFAVSGENESQRNIYLSLNYLQENGDISYGKSFGAKATDGTQNLYVFSPGDYVRVVSYYSDDESIVYPRNRIFEVVDLVILGSVADENPLEEAGDVAPHLQGQFLIVRDNDSLSGFTFSDVIASGNAAESNINLWNNRCIIEIITPRATVDPEERAYHEIAQAFNVGRDVNTGAVFHQTPNVVLSNGDVWWRRVPVNLSDYDEVNSVFLNLIQDPEEGDVVVPRFRNYYLESSTFNDTFPGTDVNGFGKMKFYLTDSSEVRRFSSVTYSDINDYSTKRIRYTSFNSYNAPYKDLPNEHGSINALVNFSDSLFVVQEDKASSIPISRTILSDALGQDTIIGSDSILGNQVFYAGSSGSDNNPESVLKVENSIYFAHKSKGEVYKFNPSNGIQVISRNGMNAFFRSAFEDVINDPGDIRVVSGYDALKDEYIITISNFTALLQLPISIYTQRPLQLIGSTGVVTDDDSSDPSDFDSSYGDPIEDNVGTGTAPDGVSPTGILVDNETIEVYADIKERILAAAEAGYQSGSFEISSVTSGSQQISTIDGTQFWDQDIADYIGDFTVGNYQYQPHPSSTLFFLFNGANNIFTITQPTDNIVYNDDVLKILFAISLNQVVQSHDDSDYNSYLDGLLPIRIRLLHNSLKITDDNSYLAVTSIKRDEQDIIELVDQIPSLIAAIDDDLATAGINSNANITALRESVGFAYDELLNHVESALDSIGGADQTHFYIDKSRFGVSDTYSGFGAFGIDEYPLDNSNVFLLSRLITLKNNLADVINPLLSLSEVDVSDAISGLANTNADLRGQIDVLTNQIQNLSIAPQGSLDVNPFIPGVVTSQLTSQAIDVLDGGDNILSFSDVRTDFPNYNSEIQFILDSLSSSGVEITPDVVQNIILSYTDDLEERIKSSEVGKVLNFNNTFLQNQSSIDRIDSVLFRQLFGDINNDEEVNVNDVLDQGSNENIQNDPILGVRLEDTHALEGQLGNAILDIYYIAGFDGSAEELRLAILDFMVDWQGYPFPETVNISTVFKDFADIIWAAGDAGTAYDAYILATRITNALLASPRRIPRGALPIGANFRRLSEYNSTYSPPLRDENLFNDIASNVNNDDG